MVAFAVHVVGVAPAFGFDLLPGGFVPVSGPQELAAAS